MKIEQITLKPIKVAVLIPSCIKEHRENCLKSLAYTKLSSNVVMDVFVLDNDYEGFAKTVNKGIQYAKGYDYIAILNDDIVVCQEWLEVLINGFIFAKMNNLNVAIVTDRAGYKGTHVLFFCALIKAEIFNVVGILDERFHPAYVEDVDFSLRCTDAGYTFLASPHNLCLHKVQGTFGANPEKDALIAKNWERFAEKWKGTKHEHFKRDDDIKYAKLVEEYNRQQKLQGEKL